MAKRGRKGHGLENDTSVLMTVRWQRPLWDRLQDWSRLTNMSTADIVRTSVDAYLQGCELMRVDFEEMQRQLNSALRRQSEKAEDVMHALVHEMKGVIEREKR